MPHTRCSWILCEYSKYLITMKPQAPAKVSTRHTSMAFLRLVWAKRTAVAMVRLLRMSTQVLMPPMSVFR